MSSLGYATPLRLERRVSRHLLAGIGLTHGGAAILVWLLPLDTPLCAAMSLLIVAAGLWAVREQCWGGRAVVGLSWEQGGHWRLERRDGRVETARLLPGSYLQPQLAVLRFVVDAAQVREVKSAGERPLPGRMLDWVAGRRAIVLLPDGVDAESFRRLRVRMRLTGNKEDGGV